MAPVLPAGCVVTVVSTHRRPPRIGDVVLIRHRDGLRVHRLIWGPPLAKRGSWRTKGDRSWLWDERTPQEAILGTVVPSGPGGHPGRGRAWRALWSLASGLVSQLHSHVAAARGY